MQNMYLKRSAHVETFLYILLVLFCVDKFSFYQSWESMNVSWYVTIPINRISIGGPKVKVMTDYDTVETF